MIGGGGSRPQSASLGGGTSIVRQKSTTSSANRGNNNNGSITRIKASSINKKLNQMPSTIFKPSMAQHKKSTSDAVLLTSLLASSTLVNNGPSHFAN